MVQRELLQPEPQRMPDAKHCAGGEKTKAGWHSPAMQHPGFGAGLTGGEYAAALVQDFPETVTLFLGTTVLSVEPINGASVR